MHSEDSRISASRLVSRKSGVQDGTEKVNNSMLRFTMHDFLKRGQCIPQLFLAEGKRGLGELFTANQNVIAHLRARQFSR
jgi:hypothetical protein